MSVVDNYIKLREEFLEIKRKAQNKLYYGVGDIGKTLCMDVISNKVDKIILCPYGHTHHSKNPCIAIDLDFF